MKNSELLAPSCPEHLMSSVDRQRRYVLQSLACPMPCPNCGTTSDYFKVTGVPVDNVDLTKPMQQEGACPECGRGLKRIVPIFAFGPGWCWGLVHVKPESDA